MTTKQLIESGVVLTEGAGAKSGRLDIQIINPGWGSSGYYSAQVLEAAAADKVFPAGTHMYLDHPGEFDKADRPNGRSVKDLAAVLTEDAKWNGTALVGQARTFGPFREALAEMADAIGISIRAQAEVSEGEAEGRQGVIIERIAEAASVDFVAAAGRGGKILQVLESARESAIADALTADDAEPELEAPATEPADATESSPQDPAASATEPAAPAATTTTLPSEEHMTDQQGAAGTAPVGSSRQVIEARLAAQHTEIVQMRARDKARGIIAEDLADAWLTPRVINRLTNELIEGLPIVNDELDVAALRDRVAAKRDVAEAEMGEALQTAGLGQVKGLGVSESVETAGAADKWESRTESAFRELGLSESAATIAAKGR